jgi:radical SAM superfamily enzyme YgiQ (UPF0313 family)
MVFVFPPSQGNPGAFRQHLGVAYLRAALVGSGITTDQYTCERPGTIENVADEVLSRKPGIVGFTVYDSNYPTALAIASSIKARRRGTRIVFGGPTATFSAEELLKCTDLIDACVMGEAEETGPAILQRILDGKDLDDGTPGIAYRRGDHTCCGPLPPLVGTHTQGVECSLDNAASPYLTRILADGRAGVLSGRGCTHHCQYCAFAALGRKTLRVHTIARVLAELEYIAEAHRRLRRHEVVAIHDDAFTLLVPRAKELCKAIIRSRLGLSLACITRADRVDDELLHLLREAGFVSVAFGLESAVPEVLRATGKVRPPDWPDPDLTPEKEFLEGLKANVVSAKKLGFNVGVSIILGLPTETLEQGAETLRFVRGLPVNYYMHNYLWLFPGTPLWKSGSVYGLEHSVNSLGLPLTTKYAYDVGLLKPARRCSLEQDAKTVRLLSADAMYSCSTTPHIGRGTAAIVLDGAEFNVEVARWAREVLSVGGQFIQIIPKGDDGRLVNQLEHDRLLLTQELVPARYHVHVLAKVSRGDGQHWEVLCGGLEALNVFRSRLLTLSVVRGSKPLRDWLNQKDSPADICELNGYMADPRQINGFLRKVRGGNLLEKIRRMTVPPDFTYVGRWLKGATPCRNLSRLEVDPSGCIRCCRHGRTIGVVGDSRRTLLRRLSAMRRATEVRRGCATCSVRDCPRCPFPGVAEKSYCSIMKKQSRAVEFMGMVHVCSRMPVLLSCLQEQLGQG